MDPALEQVLLGILANGLTAFLARASNEPTPRGSDAVDTAIREAVEVHGEAPEIHDELGGERLRDFLTSPEASSIVRQVFVSHLGSGGDSLSESRRQFVELSTIWTGIDTEAARSNAERLFSALARGADAALAAAIDARALQAIDARGEARQGELRGELAAIRAALDALRGDVGTDFSAAIEFGHTLRGQVTARHGTITPPNFDAQRRIRIDDLYVAPQLAPLSEAGSEGQDLSTFDQVAKDTYRTVILGNPGSGKTTFARKFAHDVAAGEVNGSRVGGEMVPLLVVLRDYGADKLARRVSIVDFIRDLANATYQVPPPQGALEYLLLSGRAVVIFDGLDELLEASDRREVSADIESFARLYPAAPLLVTSREVGYEQAPLDPDRFGAYRLADFDDERVKEYVDKWFALDRELSARERETETRAFMDDSNLVEDLRANPLMLALMCNIYRGEGYIPRNRPGVYEKCAVMLFERWDRGRRINVPLEFERHLRPTMQYLASWIYSEASLQVGVTERRLVDKAAEYLEQRRFGDADAARQEARRFIEFCRGRAWVFSDAGLTPVGETLYQFTHRTFLEFFTAERLVRTNPTPTDLLRALLPRVQRGEWDVVAQLACQLQDNNVEGAADELLAGLLPSHFDSSNEAHSYMLSFACRCLEFLVPSPQVAQSLAETTTTACFRVAEAALHEGFEGQDTSAGRVASAFGELLRANWENREAIAQAVESTAVGSLARASTDDEFFAVSDVAFGLDRAVLRGRVRGDLRDFWLARSRAILDATDSARVLELSRDRFELAYDALDAGLITVREVAGWHGFGSCFDHRRFLIFGGYIRSPLYQRLVENFLGADTPDRLAASLDNLRAFGELGGAQDPPWHEIDVIRIGGGFAFLSPVRAPIPPEPEPEADPRAFFGLFTATAVIMEVSEHSESASALGELASAPHRWLERLAPICQVRYGVPSAVPAEDSLCGLADDDRRFAVRWGDRQLDLLQGRRTSNYLPDSEGGHAAR